MHLLIICHKLHVDLTGYPGLSFLHAPPGGHGHAPVPIVILEQHSPPRFVILHDLETRNVKKKNAYDLENSQMASFPAPFRSRVGRYRQGEPPSPSCH